MNKTTLICLLAGLLFTACTERMICPAYQSSFMLDEEYRRDYFSPFMVDAGDTVVPKPNFYAQRGGGQAQEKQGFTYEHHKKKSFLKRIWSNPERPVLENPYLFDRIFKKRPYWKMDVITPELVHYNDKDTVNNELPTLLDSLGQPILDTTLVVEPQYPSYAVLTVPKRYKGYNIDQFNYNRKFGHLFPQPPPPPPPVDSTALVAAAADTLAADSTAKKKRGMFGMFKKKNKGKKSKGDTTQVKPSKKKDKPKKDKPKKEKKKKDRKGKKNNEEGTREEDDGG